MTNFRSETGYMKTAPVAAAVRLSAPAMSKTEPAAPSPVQTKTEEVKEETKDEIKEEERDEPELILEVLPLTFRSDKIVKNLVDITG